MEYDFSLFLRATGHVLLYGYCLLYGWEWVAGGLVFENPSGYRDSESEIQMSNTVT